MPVLFWLTTIARYVLSGFVAFLLSIAISFAVILPFAKDRSPGVGFLWFMVLIPVASLLIPLSLGTTAELIQCKVLSRRFKWANALVRSLAALPIAVGPVYAATSVFPTLRVAAQHTGLKKKSSCTACPLSSRTSLCVSRSAHRSELLDN
jgi:hypothetical protein